MTSRICGTGSALPALRVTNDDLSQIMDTNDEWISSRTGIRARHLATEETTTSLAVQASREALEQAGMQAKELDLIIAATLSPDDILPTLSCEVQQELGAAHAVAFDIGAACSGFLFALQTAHLYLQSGQYENALIIGAETLSKMMDWNDRGTCVLFGDGAGAAVIHREDIGLIHTVLGSDGARGGALACANRPINHPYHKAAADLSYVNMNGQEVYKFAVRTVPQVISQTLEEAGLTTDDISLFVLHQANRRIIESVAKRLHVSIDRFPMNLEECGNISAASVPILLDNVNRRGMIERENKIVLAGFGAGLTWGAAVLTW